MGDNERFKIGHERVEKKAGDLKKASALGTSFGIASALFKHVHVDKMPFKIQKLLQ